MKKFNLFVIAMVAMLGFSMSAKADNGVSMKCDKTTISIGESTNCTVSFTSNVGISTATISLDTSETLDVSNVKANTTAGWAESTSGTSKSAGIYAFNNSNTTKPTSGQIFSFTITLNSKAAEILKKGESCGQLCINGAEFDGAKLTNVKGTGTCFAPTVVDEPCEGPDCNPETGSFANYAIIAASIIIAGAAVVVARKSAKFFRL